MNNTNLNIFNSLNNYLYINADDVLKHLTLELIFILINYK